ncbi:hypothetical protein EJ02DRAFT_445921 [Clathrospora elynae]|uniref:Uncharacterized protein n=1 Tax=Clathrospora elynae TaxID=706981 RepID=A0A6A5SJJ0_9PLEO|nr:hypothetical protein EJ02DRAFT_445921 [Clathrospora elynae]
MSDPVTYSFYGTTVPVLRSIASSAIGILTSAKNERSNAAADTILPSDKEMLDSQFGDMLPLRMQPIILATFALSGIGKLQLNGSTPIPAMNPAEISSFDDVIALFKQVLAVLDAIDEKTYNEHAEKSVDIAVGDKTLHMTGFADYTHGFIIPNSYFHLNAIYMLLRAKGFKLGKTLYIHSWMSEQQKKDWAPLKA